VASLRLNVKHITTIKTFPDMFLALFWSINSKTEVWKLKTLPNTWQNAYPAIVSSKKWRHLSGYFILGHTVFIEIIQNTISFVL
jgi:hypothetical protein